MLHIHFTCSNQKAQPFLSCIKKVVNQLPKKDQEFIHDACFIILLDKIYGYSIQLKEKHLILLNIGIMTDDKISSIELEFIIAHEFAHCILGHTQSTKHEEQEANDLVSTWGFRIP